MPPVCPTMGFVIAIFMDEGTRLRGWWHVHYHIAIQDLNPRFLIFKEGKLLCKQKTKFGES